MRREPNYLLLGATVATIAALFVGVVLFVAGGGKWGTRYQSVRVKFAHDLPLPRLQKGSLVTCGGMPVGKVTDVTLQALPRGSGQGEPELYVVIDASVDAAIELRKDCRVRAECLPLGGNGDVVIVHRGYSSQTLAEGEAVEGLPPAGLTAVVGQLGDKLAVELDERNPEGLLHMVKGQLDAKSPAALAFKVHAIADDLVATSAQIRTQMNPEQQGALLATLDSALGNVKAITGVLREQTNAQDPGAMFGRIQAILAALGQASQTASAMLQDNRPAVQTAVSNVADTTGMIKTGLLPSVMAQADTANSASLISKFHVAADRTNTALGNLQEMTGSAKDLLLVNQQSVEATILNLQETSEHLRAASREIRRNPWRLLYRPGASEARQVAVADAARSFSDAAGRLDSAFARLEAYGRTAGPDLAADDPKLKDLQGQLELALKNLSESEKKFWESFAGSR